MRLFDQVGSLAARCMFVMLSVVGALLVSSCTSGADALANSQRATMQMPDSGSNGVTSAPMHYRLVLRHLAEDSAPPQSNAPIRLIGRGSTSRIVDSDGNVLKDGRTGDAIYGLQLSPHRTSALVYFGDATYTIAPVERLEDAVPLPVQPTGFDDATGFTWRWLDDVHLLGESHLLPIEVDGKTASEIDALPPRAVLLYVYSVASGEMAHVEVSDGLPKLFTVHEASGWNLSLLTVGEDAGRALEATLGRVAGD